MYKVLLKTEFGIYEDSFTEWDGTNPRPVRYHSIEEAKQDIKDFIEEANKIDGNDYSSENFYIYEEDKEDIKDFMQDMRNDTI